ncbi:hypothetical protein FRC07_000414 [Ceratobasidium sp. 392]|nr:hypothetical protein FRC07_000414 [Ceratobasidium sp. 392]
MHGQTAKKSIVTIGLDDEFDVNEGNNTGPCPPRPLKHSVGVQAPETPPATQTAKRPRNNTSTMADLASRSLSAPPPKKPAVASPPEECAPVLAIKTSPSLPPQLAPLPPLKSASSPSLGDSPSPPLNVSPLSPPETAPLLPLEPASSPLLWDCPLPGNSFLSPLKVSSSSLPQSPAKISQVQDLLRIPGWLELKGPDTKQLNLQYEVRLVCAECNSLLSVAGGRFWVLRCRHLLNNACYNWVSNGLVSQCLSGLFVWPCPAGFGKCLSTHWSVWDTGNWYVLAHRGAVKVVLMRSQ